MAKELGDGSINTLLGLFTSQPAPPASLAPLCIELLPRLLAVLDSSADTIAGLQEAVCGLPFRSGAATEPVLAFLVPVTRSCLGAGDPSLLATLGQRVFAHACGVMRTSPSSAQRSLAMCLVRGVCADLDGINAGCIEHD